MNANEKAAWAKRLKDNDDFKLLMTEFHEDAIAAFVGSTTPEDREQAHAQLRAKQQLENILDAAGDAKLLSAKRKGQHRE